MEWQTGRRIVAPGIKKGGIQPMIAERAVKERRAEKDDPRLLRQNVQQIAELEAALRSGRSPMDRMVDGISEFCGSVAFVYIHLLWFALWIGANLALPVRVRFDPFPFGLLTLVVSLEAIFLSTFVLVSQNRQAQMADRRAELDLQTNLLAEHEVTRILALLDAITTHLGIEEGDDPELPELEEDVEPESLLSELEAQEGKAAGSSKKTNGNNHTKGSSHEEKKQRKA